MARWPVESKEVCRCLTRHLSKRWRLWSRSQGQPQSVAKRLTAWLTRMSEGDLPREEHERFLQDVCSAIVMEDRDAD